MRKQIRPCDPAKITYSVSVDLKTITFQPCGVVSSHPSDVIERYCPACGRFMELVELARELRAVGGAP